MTTPNEKSKATTKNTRLVYLLIIFVASLSYSCADDRPGIHNPTSTEDSKPIPIGTDGLGPSEEDETEDGSESEEPPHQEPTDPLPPVESEPAPNPDLTKLSFETVKKQLLSAKCLKCHSGDKPAHDIDLSSLEKILLARVHGKPLIVPGQPQRSALVRTIVSRAMPPPRSGLSPVTEAELALLEKWILEGAND